MLLGQELLHLIGTLGESDTSPDPDASPYSHDASPDDD
jgi:hypothetical protein